MKSQKSSESNSRNVQVELNERQLLDLLFSYNAKIASEQRLDSLLILMADLGRKLVQADRCSLWLLDDSKHEVWTKVAHGVPELRMKAAEGFVGNVISTGKSILIEDAYNDPRFNQAVDTQTGYRTSSMMVIPIFNNEGEVMGAYQALNKMTQSKIFSNKDLEYLQLTANYSGKSLESAMLYQEIENTQKEIIFTMGEVGESRSRETGYHVKRVAEYCYLLGSLAGYSEEFNRRIKLASPMHDIGKIAIPDSVLKKPGRLTDAEFDIMKTHAMLGYEVLCKSSRILLRTAATIAYTHHEKWNGSGYPRALLSDDIPIEGRICAVADVFDALSNERCYKKAWPRKKVERFFEDEKGKIFDPELTDLLLANLDEFYRINEMFQDKNRHDPLAEFSMKEFD